MLLSSKLTAHQSGAHACRGLWELGQYSIRATFTNTVGMTFADINRDGTGMGSVWLIFVIEWAVFLGLAWYLEQVLSSATGIRKHWLFPLQCAASLPLTLPWPCLQLSLLNPTLLTRLTTLLPSEHDSRCCAELYVYMLLKIYMLLQIRKEKIR